MTHFVSTNPVARKKHFCDLCHRIIRPNEKYRRSAGMDGSTAWTWRECSHCEALIPYVLRHTFADDGYDEATVLDWEPHTVEALRVKVLWRKKWQHADGRLYPVPDVEWLEDRHGFGHPVAIKAAP